GLCPWPAPTASAGEGPRLEAVGGDRRCRSRQQRREGEISRDREVSGRVRGFHPKVIEGTRREPTQPYAVAGHQRAVERGLLSVRDGGTVLHLRLARLVG